MGIRVVRRVEVASGVAWCSDKLWFWLSFGGDIYSFMLAMGRLSICFERKYTNEDAR